MIKPNLPRSPSTSNTTTAQDQHALSPVERNQPSMTLAVGPELAFQTGHDLGRPGGEECRSEILGRPLFC